MRRSAPSPPSLTRWLALLVATAVLSATAAAPVLSPNALPATAPNASVILTGDGLASVTTVRLCAVKSGNSKCGSVQPAFVSNQSLVVTLPAEFPGAGYLTLSACDSDGACSPSVVLNAPRGVWIRGPANYPNGVHPGGSLSIFGRNLAFDGVTGACPPLLAPTDMGAYEGMMSAAAALRQGVSAEGVAAFTASASAIPSSSGWRGLLGVSGVSASLVGSTGASYPITITLASCYRLDGVVGSGVPLGGYTLFVNNGLYDGMGVEVGTVAVVGARGPSTGWPATVFAYGVNCSSVVGCLAAAKLGGGGIVSLPAGVYAMPSNAVLDVGEGVQLVGAGQGATVLEWASNVAPPPAALVSCYYLGHVEGVTLNVTSAVQDVLSFVSGAAKCSAHEVGVWVDFTDPAFPIGNSFSAYDATACSLTQSSLFHRGNCSRSWPMNTIFYMREPSYVLLANITAVGACQGYSVDSATNTALDEMYITSVGNDSQVRGRGACKSDSDFRTVSVCYDAMI